MSRQDKEELSAFPSQVSDSAESEPSTNGGQETRVAKNRNSSSKPDAPVKMTLYISKGIAKEFKKLAIDEELDYSQLAEQAFTEFVKNHSTASASL